MAKQKVEVMKAQDEIARAEEIGKQIDITSGGEFSASSAAMTAKAEVEGALVVAQRVPRNEDASFARIIRSCGRSGFAEAVSYAFPRGGKKITGPSVYLAREMAKAWGNVTYGHRISRDDDDSRTIRAYAWDLQHNTRVEAEDTFKKLIQRKISGETQWISPDERDLRELTNRRAAILVRNCLLQLMPQDFVDDAIKAANKTMREGIEKDPDAARKKIIVAFDGLNIKPEAIETYLGNPIAQASPAQLADLRAIFESIRDGNSKWADYSRVSGSDEPKTDDTDTLKVEDLTPTPEETERYEKLADEEGFTDGLTKEQQEAILKACGREKYDLAEFNEWLKAEYDTAVLGAIHTDELRSIIDHIGTANKGKKPAAAKKAKTLSKTKQASLLRASHAVEKDLIAHITKKYGTGRLEEVPAEFEMDLLKWIG